MDSILIKFRSWSVFSPKKLDSNSSINSVTEKCFNIIIIIFDGPINEVQFQDPEELLSALNTYFFEVPSRKFRAKFS